MLCTRSLHLNKSITVHLCLVSPCVFLLFFFVLQLYGPDLKLKKCQFSDFSLLVVHLNTELMLDVALTRRIDNLSFNEDGIIHQITPTRIIKLDERHEGGESKVTFPCTELVVYF